jgi:hypothetical protein
MNATMIKIERSKKMADAIDRCKRVHPKVKRIDENTVLVAGRNGRYTVRIIRPRPDLVLAECNCAAGQRAQLCFHIAGALAAPHTAGLCCSIDVTSTASIAPPSAPAHPSAGVLVKPQRKAVVIDGWEV